jgi:16S rRNA (adenine1518-N6/adenine1519-N6)-dimethyltransferase
LTAGRDPRTVLREAGLRPKRSFGQNFLVAESIAAAIAEACVPDAEVGRARVVEIGAGTGALTQRLARRAGTLVAIERDRELVPLLARETAETGVRVVEGDAASLDFAALLAEGEPTAPRVLCGNLPYAITGVLLRRAVENAAAVDRVIFMVQDEVCQRLVARAGSKERGALTVFVQAAFGVRRLLRAPPGAFHPSPDVTSAVVELLPLRPPRARETRAFRALVRAAFQSRRKTLRNAWKGVVHPSSALEPAAAHAGISLDLRGETLEVEDFARMAEEIEK